MIEERNIYMSDNFLKLLKNVGYVTYDSDLQTTMLGKDNAIFFNPPHFFCETDKIYCDVEGYENVNLKSFHDFEYIYDVEKTYRMKSKCHKPLKHNINVFSNRLDSRYNSDFSFKIGSFNDIEQLHQDWIEPDLTYIGNNSLMINLVYNHITEFKQVSSKVFYLEAEPVGFVLYDESPAYTHLFFVFAAPSVEYLQDYITWLFFRQKVRDNDRKPINFGGIYGDGNIKKDKDRLCPYEVRNRWSWGY